MLIVNFIYENVYKHFRAMPKVGIEKLSGKLLLVTGFQTGTTIQTFFRCTRL